MGINYMYKHNALAIHNAVMMCGKKKFKLGDIKKHCNLARTTIRKYLKMYYDNEIGDSGHYVYEFKDNSQLFNSFDDADVLKAKWQRKSSFSRKANNIKFLSALPSVVSNIDMIMIGYGHSTLYSLVNKGYFELISKGKYKKTNLLLDLEKQYMESSQMDNTKGRNNNPAVSDLIVSGGVSVPPPIIVSLCDQMLVTFRSFSNQDKAMLISTLFPIATEAELLAKFDELYPNYILPNVKEGDMLFHPLIGKVKIEKASPKKLGFYGNGQAWEADRNGHLIVNGKTHDRRTLFIDFADYQKYMEESMI